jgi:general secretion pathway protein F
MKTFEYRGYGADGRAARGLVEATSVKEARDRLCRDGVLAERIAVTSRKVRLRAGGRALIYREVTALLGAGLPLVKALDILIQSPELREAHIVLAGVRDSVREGQSLADALVAASPSTTAFEHAIIAAAERSGNVERMLESLASFIEEQEKVKEKVQGALIYPSIVFAVGLCVATVMLGVLVPKARMIMAGSGAKLPALTVWMTAVGRFLMHWGLVLALGLAAAYAWAVRHAARDADWRRTWSRRVFRLPMIGRGYTLLANMRFARTMAILLGGGVSAIDALAHAGRATGNAWIAELSAAEAEKVRHGSSLSDAVRRIPPLAETLPGWMRIGEAGGGLDRLLENAGRRYQEQWDRFVGRSLSILEPVLILAIGGFVLLVTLSVLLPVLSLTKGIGK